jgi:hypothetical protein
MLSMNERAIGRKAKVGIVALILVILIIGAIVYYTQLEKTGGIKSSKPQLAGNFYPIQTLGQQLILQINLTSPTNITNANSIELQLSGGGISGVITLTYSSTSARFRVLLFIITIRRKLLVQTLLTQEIRKLD